MSEKMQSKLAEQATAKADLSYSYWAANEVKGAAPPPEAKKLTPEEVKAEERHLERAASAGISPWNAAGTFEERSVTSWATEVVKELLSSIAVEPYAARITEVVSCSGDACQWVVRGQTRANFDLVIDFRWAIEMDGTTASGKATIPNAAWDELDELQIETRVESPKDLDASSRDKAMKAVENLLLPCVREKLEQLIDRIREYGTTQPAM